MCYIDHQEDLESLCQEIKETTNIIALDTEFRKHREYFPTLSIIQLSFFNGTTIKNYIIDVLVKELDLSCFFEILNSDKIKKIIHSCSQDLEGLYKLSGKVAVEVEDTQVMAEFCGMNASLSYVDLVKETLKIVLKKDKKIQISDWMKRPLTDRQLEYASCDVDYLLEIYIYLLQILDKNKNYKYYREHMKQIYGETFIDNLVENSWKKMRFRLGDRNYVFMQAMKHISRLRETIAMKKNVIKNLIVPDSFLKSLLVYKPKTIEQLDNIFKDDEEILKKNESLKKVFIQSYSKIYKKFEGKKLENKEYLVELKDKTITKKYNEINDYLIAECKKININPELVLNKNNIISYLTNSEKLENVFLKWQIELFGEKIKQIKEY